MSYQEKKNIVSLIGTLIIFGLYWLYMFQHYSEEMNSTGSFRFWGAFILILIPVAIVAKIILQIGFNIIFRLTTKEQEPSFVDELDKIIELKAVKCSHYIFVLGFLLAMGSLVLGMEPRVMFLILIFTGVGSELAGLVAQLYLYRRGV